MKQEERQGLKPLWQEVEKFLASLSRAERIRKCRKQKEEERSCSFKSPFKHKAASGGQEEWETENNKTGKLELENIISERSTVTLKSEPQRDPWDTFLT